MIVSIVLQISLCNQSSDLYEISNLSSCDSSKIPQILFVKIGACTQGKNVLKQNSSHVCAFTAPVGGGGGYDNVDEEMDMSKVNIFVSKTNKLSAEARIFRGP